MPDMLCQNAVLPMQTITKSQKAQEIVSIEPTLPIQEETTAFKERICFSTSSIGTAHKKDPQHKDQAKGKASLQPLSIQQNNTPCAISIKDQNQTVKQHKQKP